MLRSLGDAILEIVEHRGFSSVTLSELLVDSMIPSPDAVSPPNSGYPDRFLA